MDWLTAALKVQRVDNDHQTASTSGHADAPQDRFVFHEPVRTKIYGEEQEEKEKEEEENAEKLNQDETWMRKSPEHEAQPEKQQQHVSNEHLRQIVTQICTLFLAVGTLKSTERRADGVNSVFKVSAYGTWSGPRRRSVIENTRMILISTSLQSALICCMPFFF